MVPSTLSRPPRNGPETTKARAAKGVKTDKIVAKHATCTNGFIESGDVETRGQPATCTQDLARVRRPTLQKWTICFSSSH